MKKFKTVLQVCALLLSLAVCPMMGYATDISVKSNDYEGIVRIETSEVVKKGNIPVIVKIIRPEVSHTDITDGRIGIAQGTVYIGEVYSEDTDGLVGLDIPPVLMPQNAPSGRYTVVLSVDGSKNYEAEFEYKNFKKLKIVLNEINAITESSADFDSKMERILTQNAEILGIDTEEYQADESVKIITHQAIKMLQYTTETENLEASYILLKETFEDSACLAALNYYSDEGKLESNLKKYAEKYGVDMSEQSEYAKLSDTRRQRVIDRVRCTSFAEIKEVAPIFNEQVVLEMISEASYGEIYSLINKNNDLLGVPLSELDRLEAYDKDTVFRNMISKNYTDKENLVNEFLNMVNAVNLAGNINYTGGGGGGGGSRTYGASAGNPLADDGQSVVPIEKECGFEDIDEVSWAADAIDYLRSNQVISGKGENSFAPFDYVTRAEFTKMAVLLFGGDENVSEREFYDVKAEDWYYAYVKAGVGAGFVLGFGDGSFRPDDNITRQDMAVILMRAARAPLAEGITEKFEDDGMIADYASEAVRELKAAGVIAGDENNCFHPNSCATRAETAVMLYRMCLLNV